MGDEGCCRKIESWHLWLLLFILYCVSGLCHVRGDYDQEAGSRYSRTVSSVTYSETKLAPYAWSYIRVDLPAWFSVVSFVLRSDADYDGGGLMMDMPMVCLRDGSLPLPDASENAFQVASSVIGNGPSTQIARVQSMEQCSPLERNMTIDLTNEQISPGVVYLGIFNGIGSRRTQSRMINRGSTLTYTAAITIKECISSASWGPYCNETVTPLSCAMPSTNNSAYTAQKSADNIIFCRTAFEHSCQRESEPRIYFIDILEISELLSISVKDKTINASEVTLMCYARLDAMPLENLYDYFGDLSDSPLVIRAPKAGRWFISVIPVRLGHVKNGVLKTCYTLEGQVHQCPQGKAGLKCTYQKYQLQTFVNNGLSGFSDFNYLPLDGNLSSSAADFSLLSFPTDSSGMEIDPIWIYFLMDIPKGAAGYNIQLKLSDRHINYEIYARYGGLPNSQSWDYFYSNSTSNSDGDTFFKLYDSSQGLVRFYIFYAREGTWAFGLRNLTQTNSASQSIARMSISLDHCPNRCSDYGKCNTVLDSSELTFYSFCKCDTNHGGFDCSVVLVTPQGKFWRSFLLIASNAAALLPAFWAFYQRSLADWFLFMASGISSGLYHACDVGTYCVLNFGVLQFMDFWLSFMAVVSTVVYLTTISESSKRTLLTAAWILTALMAANGAARSSNLILITVIGVVGLLVGWVIELKSKHRLHKLSLGFSWHTIQSLQNLKHFAWNLFKILSKRYRWRFLLAGSISFALAATSWTLESSDTYWIWHCIWHLSIYTSSFFFLCSKVNIDSTEEPSASSYELQHQNPSLRSPQIL